MLQNENTNGTADRRITGIAVDFALFEKYNLNYMQFPIFPELQSRLDNLISELDATGDENVFLSE